MTSPPKWPNEPVGLELLVELLNAADAIGDHIGLTPPAAVVPSPVDSEPLAETGVSYSATIARGDVPVPDSTDDQADHHESAHEGPQCQEPPDAQAQYQDTDQDTELFNLGPTDSGRADIETFEALEKLTASSDEVDEPENRFAAHIARGLYKSLKK